MEISTKLLQLTLNYSMHKLLKEQKLFFIGIILATLFMMADLYSKFYAFAFLDKLLSQGAINYSSFEVTSFFNLVQVWNRGVSFGMFNDLNNGRILIIILNFTITTILLVWLFKNKHPYLSLSLSFIIGGALGNLIDRIKNNAVADFLDFHAFSYHWPAFNLADSFIFIGVSMLLLENFFIKKDEKQKK